MTKTISIVVPVFNEEEGIKNFHSVLSEVLSKINGYCFEIIYVNDGSNDNSPLLISELSYIDKRIILINLSRNFGHQNALTCGLDYASGDAAITMDADLQHPPQLINELILKWEEGYDIVYTVRKDNDSVGILKRISSKIFYKLINILSNTKITESAADFRLISRKVVKVLKHDLNERDKFLRGLISWIGFKTTKVNFEVGTRKYGKSKYTFLKMLKLGFTGIASFSNFPLKLGIFFGSVLMLLSILYGVYSVILGLISGKAVPGWTTLMIFIMFFSSIQFLLIGLLGYYIGYIFNEVKKRPSYIVDSIIRGG